MDDIRFVLLFRCLEIHEVSSFLLCQEHGANPLVGEHFDQDGVFDSAVNHDGFFHAADGLQIRHHLAGMTEVGQTVDNRDGAVFCQSFHFFLCKGTDHDAIQVAGEHSSGILRRLASADLRILGADKQCVSAQLIHTADDKIVAGIQAIAEVIRANLK